MMDLITKYCNVLAKPVRKNFLFFIFMFLLSATIYLFAYKTYRQPVLKIRYFVDYIFDIYVICIFLSFLKTKFRSCCTLIFSIFAYVLGGIEMICINEFHTTVNPQILQLVLETNPRETSEFFATYLPGILNLKNAIVPFLAILHIALCYFFPFKKRIAILSSYRSYIIDVVVVLLLLLLIKFSPFILPLKKSQFLAFSQKTVGGMEALIIRDTENNDYNELMTNPLSRFLYSYKTCHLMERQIEKLYQSSSNVKVEKKSEGCPHIVLVIGESYNKHHSQLYGYHVANTPNQMRYYENGNLVRFADVVSPWDITSYAFKCFMTTWGVGDKGEWCDYPLITAIMRKAGYRVTFFTNQFAAIGGKGTICDLSGGFFLNDKRLSDLQFSLRNEHAEKYDGLLVENNIEKLKWGGKPEFTVFHFIGQHFDYAQRCPQDRKYITLEQVNRKDLPLESQKVICDYDNSILYNDLVLSKIIDWYKDKDAVVVYMSDHSEGMFAPGVSNKFGRSSFAEIDYANVYENFQVPMWIYCSNIYKNKHAEVYNMMLDAVNKPYMTDLIPQLIMHIAGVQTTTYDAKKDILSPRYDVKRKRLLRNEVDYNRIIQSK